MFCGGNVSRNEAAPQEQGHRPLYAVRGGRHSGIYASRSVAEEKCAGDDSVARMVGASAGAVACCWDSCDVTSSGQPWQGSVPGTHDGLVNMRAGVPCAQMATFTDMASAKRFVRTSAVSSENAAKTSCAPPAELHQRSLSGSNRAESRSGGAAGSSRDTSFWRMSGVLTSCGEAVAVSCRGQCALYFDGGSRGNGRGSAGGRAGSGAVVSG